MHRTEVVVIGAGQAGLAVSRCLTDASVDHVVLERGRLAERWRSERWDSLRLLTPNWASRLPGWHYTGDDPHGFMTAAELIAYFEAYAASFGAPVLHDRVVREVRPFPGGFVVRTDDEAWRAREVVVATGWSDQPRVPKYATAIDRGIVQLTPSSYRNPGQVPDGRVLVAGASASGVQLADELARAGREVVLAVGGHARVPRRYRGLDIYWWLDRIGALAESGDGGDRHRRARFDGSLQLIGRQDGRDVDLTALQSLGVRLAGRMVGADATSAVFADDLPATTAAAHQRLQALLARIDRYIDAHRMGPRVVPPAPVSPVDTRDAVRRLDLRRDAISAVVWATGYARRYDWLPTDALDETGEIVQTRGVTRLPGLYVVGLRYQHRRDSNFIDGVRHDAAFVVDHLIRRRRNDAAA